MKPQMEAIIRRCEEVRTFLGLNKSRFSHAIGMKPQTYNNFIGSQGTKPSMELIHGIVTRFRIDAHWLLTGEALAGQGPGIPTYREVQFPPLPEAPGQGGEHPGTGPGKTGHLPLEETAVMVAAMISQGVNVNLKVSLDPDIALVSQPNPSGVGMMYRAVPLASLQAQP